MATSLKQWGANYPEELAPSVSGRVPSSYQLGMTRYFQDRYTGNTHQARLHKDVATHGRTHSNIKVLLNADYREIEG